jgi:organic hydroperoxide reductase OsmC/OhrA
VVVSSESDHRGLLGLDQVDAGPLELRLRYLLEAPGVPAERLAALVDWAERHSPVSTAARRELPVAVEVDLAGAPPGG